MFFFFTELTQTDGSWFVFFYRINADRTTNNNATLAATIARLFVNLIVLN